MATRAQKDAFSQLKAVLSDYGLGGLTNWLWSQIRSGEPESSIMFSIREQPAFKARFPGLEVMRKAGIQAMTPARYIEVENQYKDVLRRFGVHPSRFDTPQKLVGFFAGAISAPELERRFEIYDRTKTVYGPRLRQRLYERIGVEITDDDAFGIVTGQRQDLIDAYAKATKTKPLTAAQVTKLFQGEAVPKVTGPSAVRTPSLAALESAERESVAEEKAAFAAGGQGVVETTRRRDAF